MIKKVLVAEDMDRINYAVSAVLKDLDIFDIAHAQYCDKAFLLAKKAAQDGEAFDLLICNLSFKEDYREESIKSRKELIAILKSEYPGLKVLVNSTSANSPRNVGIWTY